MVKTISCIYKDKAQFNSFIIEHELFDYPNLLVQVFIGTVDKDLVLDIQTLVNDQLPNAVMIGCTSSGQISEGRLLENEIVLSFTIFEKTQIKSAILHLDSYNDSFEMGKSLASELASFDTKVILLYPSGFEMDVQLLIEGLHEEYPDVIISGGIAGDSGAFQESLAFSNSEVTSKGFVAVALNSEVLKANTYSNYQWQEIGKSFTVTKAKGTTIYSIDNKKPIQILRRYLGENFINELPRIGVEFPFILEKNGEKVSVFIIKLLKNGTIVTNRSVKDGEKLTLAYPNIKQIIEDSVKGIKDLSKKHVETIFIYSCIARKMIMRDFTETELEMLHSIGNSVGFFANGEILHRKNQIPQIVGHSMTFITLSENESNQVKKANSFKYKIPESMSTVISLTHLMQASQLDIRHLNDHLVVSEQYYKSLFDNNTDLVYSLDLLGHFTSVNPAFIKAFGFEREEVIGYSALKFIKNEDIPRVRMHFYRALKGKEQYYNIEIPSKDGKDNLYHIKTIPITINNETVGIYGIGQNITEKMKIEEKITQLAYFDQETGLPNRMKLTDKLEELLEKSKKKKRKLAVISIDMDRFNMINDSLGHFAGDAILKEIAYRIKRVLPKGSFFGRFSGDKFSLILTKNVTIDEIIISSKTILEAISKPIIFENQEFFLAASIGVSFYPDDGLDAQALFKNADIGVNRSKAYGGNRITFFSMEMDEEAKVRLELESYLRKALQKDEFYLVYQPLIDLNTCKIFGSEALIRWNHPKLGLVSPAEFIPLAEETGLIGDIGRWVLKTACIQNKKWQLMGNDDLSISVNVSAHQFQHHDFINDVKKALQESGLEPQYLTLELTESAMIRNIDYSIAVIEILQRLGVKVSIDDFGTGYSSLSYLRNLPINTLKIDRSFINNISDDSSDVAIVKAIITMGNGLDVKVVAEGVESKNQLLLLKELNCHYAQGYYIDKPLSTDIFEKKIIKIG
ncbi:bifunctional diguanylate cyclase/phosphodiesterase [Bacillus massilinigeriensis]|uniref:bifunctional diguanylate cyclase/phosphodiesterase n=1 Tax=Bacillus massilionigeriensis TaxID=1805475 RepID=UPI00096B22C3|nr:EAL domain-containing protein [Bacillus massilionigeriensis]